MKKISRFFGLMFALMLGIMASAQVSLADFTLPTLPVTDLETAGTAVAALIGVAVVIGVVFRLLKKA